MRRKVLMMSDLQSAAEEIEIVDAATYDADLARVTAERDSNKRLHDGCLELYRRAVENLTVAEAERDALKAEEVESANEVDAYRAKIRIVEAERDRAREALREIEPYLDSLICYASTINEHLPNGFPAKVRAALAPAQDRSGEPHG